tara:strand:- start:1255 stop:1881 length:627 start_codon:yes stop_codon:yes gene_type:complete
MFDFKIGRLFNYRVGKFFSEEECLSIIKSLDDSGKLSITTEFGDLALSVYEMSYDNMDESVIKTMVGKRLNRFSKNLNRKIRDNFFIKYYDDKTDMDLHYDGSITTTLVYLNTDFKGGGTDFPLAKKTHIPQDYLPGHYMHFNANSFFAYHRGLPVTEGAKYVFVVRTQKLTLLSIITLLPWRIFRDVFLVRFLYNVVFNKKFRRNGG